jgi:hypothetical protein
VTWRWDKQLCRLHAANAELDLPSLRSVTGRWFVGTRIEAIVYRASTVTLIMRGPFLDHWITDQRGFEVRDEP